MSANRDTHPDTGNDSFLIGLAFTLILEAAMVIVIFGVYCWFHGWVL